MLPESDALAPPATPLFAPRRRATRLLLLHHEDRRLLALVEALGDAGYRVQGAASAEEARRMIDRGVPDALLTSAGAGVPMPGLVFARECLARFADLRVLYLTGLPWAASLPLVARERLLRLPFTADDLAAQLHHLTRPTPPARLLPAQMLAG